MISGSTGSGASIWSRWRDSFGETHLTVDAVVAYVDGELAAGPAGRAAEHAARCLLCAGEVAEQRRTRGRIRGADAPGASSALLSALRAIPDETLPPAVGPGEVDAPDVTGSPDTPGRPARGRRGEARGLRRGLPVAVASGIALGSVALAAVPAVSAVPMTTQIARSIGPGATTPGRGAEAALTTRPPSAADRAVGTPAPTGAAAGPGVPPPPPGPVDAIRPAPPTSLPPVER